MRTMTQDHSKIIADVIEMYSEWLECDGVDASSFLIDILARDVSKLKLENEYLRKRLNERV